MDSSGETTVLRPAGIGVRHTQAFMTFLCMVVAYYLRVNLSVAIVAMTEKTANQNFAELPWTPAMKGTILSAFFWGYIIMQVPAGHLSRKYGAKKFLFAAMLICGILTVLSPFFAVQFQWLVFCFTRVAQGFFQGFITPSINTHLAKWTPPGELSRTFTFVICGMQLGTVATLLVAGFLAVSPGGWPSIFYVTGGCAVLWSFIWFFVGADSPDTHSGITEEERAYIKATLLHSSSESQNMKTPWSAIAKSIPVWALFVTQCTQNWGFYTILTLLPSYMSHILKFNMENNGLLSALPYFCTWILSIIFSWIADYIQQNKIMSLNASRKMWNTIAHWGGALALFVLGVTDASVTMAVVLLTVAVGLNSGIFMGYLTTTIDLAPNFAGLLMGISNGFSNITSFLGPLVAGFIISDEENASQWKTVFWLAALIFFIGNFIFLIFGSTEVEPWNEPKTKCLSELE